jgi:hypothetical protein
LFIRRGLLRATPQVFREMNDGAVLWRNARDLGISQPDRPGQETRRWQRPGRDNHGQGRNLCTVLESYPLAWPSATSTPATRRPRTISAPVAAAAR